MGAFDIIIGIDFGMTYTGVAVASIITPAKEVRIVDPWPDTGSRMGKCQMDKASKDWSSDEEEAIGSKNLEMWYREYLSTLHSHIDQVRHDQGADIATIPLEVLITIPASWNKNSVDFRQFQEFLHTSGLGSLQKVSILAEPEASAFHTSFMPGEDALVVCDAGGGTVDEPEIRCCSVPSEECLRQSFPNIWVERQKHLRECFLRDATRQTTHLVMNSTRGPLEELWQSGDSKDCDLNAVPQLDNLRHPFEALTGLSKACSDISRKHQNTEDKRACCQCNRHHMPSVRVYYRDRHNDDFEGKGRPLTWRTNENCNDWHIWPQNKDHDGTGSWLLSEKANASVNFVSALGMGVTFLCLDENMDLYQPSIFLNWLTRTILNSIPGSGAVGEILQHVPNEILFAGLTAATTAFTGTTFAWIAGSKIRTPIVIASVMAGLWIVFWFMLGITVEEMILVCIPLSISFGIMSGSFWKQKKTRVVVGQKCPGCPESPA